VGDLDRGQIGQPAQQGALLVVQDATASHEQPLSFGEGNHIARRHEPGVQGPPRGVPIHQLGLRRRLLGGRSEGGVSDPRHECGQDGAAAGPGG